MSNMILQNIVWFFLLDWIKFAMKATVIKRLRARHKISAIKASSETGVPMTCTQSRAASIHESLYSNRVSFIKRAARKVVFGGRISVKPKELQRFSSICCIDEHWCLTTRTLKHIFPCKASTATPASNVTTAYPPSTTPYTALYLFNLTWITSVRCSTSLIWAGVFENDSDLNARERVHMKHSDNCQLKPGGTRGNKYTTDLHEDTHKTVRVGEGRE